MLAGVLELHDIRDAEAFCIAIIRKSRIQVTGPDLEDALSYLVSELWIYSEKWEPERGGRFSRSANSLVRLRLIDWHRARTGQHYRTGHDAPVYAELEPDALAGGDMDPSVRGAPDLVRLLRDGACQVPPGHPTNPRRLARTATV